MQSVDPHPSHHSGVVIFITSGEKQESFVSVVPVYLFSWYESWYKTIKNTINTTDFRKCG